MASERQVDYIKSLADRRDLSTLTDEHVATLHNDAYLSQLNNAQVDGILKLLKKLPWKPQEVLSDAPVVAVVNKGRYFVTDPTDGVEKFIKVDIPEPPSRWAGYTFVSVQASDDFYPIKDKTHREQILAEIQADPITAMNQYGIRLGVCGCCGRTLTARDSRLRGLGPICAAKIMGEPTLEEEALLTQLGLI